MEMKLSKKKIGIALVFLVILSMAYGFYRVLPVTRQVEAIDYCDMIEIGGISQYIQIRGDNVDHPIILFLHGGPGSAQSSFAYHYQDKLEEDFIVVNWDQRGAGRSYSRDIPIKSMTIDQFVLDTNEVVDYLLNRFNRKRIYLVGHSWGSVLGMKTIKAYPDKFYAYIGMGQAANMAEGEKISYDFVLNEAKNRNNETAIKNLTDIGEPPYGSMRDIAIERKWVSEFGGSFRNVSLDKLLKENLSNEELALYQEGAFFSITNLFDSLMDINLFEEIKKVDVPVYFCLGRYDYQTPSKVAKDYLDILQAPSKEVIWFEESAHSPNFDQPDAFYQTMKKIYGETYSK